jgi:hypothetical protein
MKIVLDLELNDEQLIDYLRNNKSIPDFINIIDEVDALHGNLKKFTFPLIIKLMKNWKNEKTGDTRIDKILEILA